MNQGDEFNKIRGALNESGFLISRRYVEIYNKPTGYNTLDEMVKHIKESNANIDKMIKNYNETFSTDFKKVYSKEEEIYAKDDYHLIEIEKRAYLKWKKEFNK